MAEPLTIALVGGALLASSGGQSQIVPRGALGSAWVHPMPRWYGYEPAVSDGFQSQLTEDHRQHLGLDIMYRRRPNAIPGREPPMNDVDGSKHYFVPRGLVCYAAHDAEIWAVNESELGWSVTLDCGRPYAVFYQHLERVLVPHARGAIVRAGAPIGVVGGARTGYGLRHLHLEVWYQGPRSNAIDPRESRAPAGGLQRWHVLQLGDDVRVA